MYTVMEKKSWLSIFIFMTFIYISITSAYPMAETSAPRDSSSWESLMEWLNSTSAWFNSTAASSQHAVNVSLESVKKWLKEDVAKVKILLNNTENRVEEYLENWRSIISKYSTVKYWLDNSSNATQEALKTINRDARVYLQEAQNEILSLTESLNNITSNMSDRIHSIVDPVIVENYVIETVCRIAGVKNCDQCKNSSNSTTNAHPVVCYVCCNGTTDGNPLPPPPPKDENTKKMTQWFIEAFNWLGLHAVYQFMAPQRDNRQEADAVVSVIENFNFHFNKKPTFLNGVSVSIKSTFDIDEVCGYYTYSKDGRVVGGSEVNSQGAFPWQLSLSTAMFGMFYQHRCGATLLSERWVLTAAHCMQALGLRHTVVIGGFLSQNKNDVAQIRKIERVISHPRFDSVLYEQDIALIKLREPMSYSSLILPACLPQLDIDYAGKTAVLTGWGREWDNGPLTEQLNKVDLPVITNAECMKWYAKSRSPQNIPERTFLCAGVRDGTKDACSGDSGGPLINYREDRRAEIIGIVSWGIGCGAAGRPGVYTRVNKYSDWINQTIKEWNEVDAS